MIKKEYFINFSGLYDGLPECDKERVCVDLTSLYGTNCYCSEDASRAVRMALEAIPAEALHWIDTGDYHYASLFFLEKIRTTYTLFLFDHHPDDQDSAFGTDILSCGNWVARARQLPNQSADFLIERFPPFVQPASGQQINIFDCSETACLKARTVDGLDLAGLHSRNIGSSCATFQQAVIADKQEKSVCGREKGDRPKAYLSIDKDVLDKQFARTNWDHGSMTLVEMKELIENIAVSYDIIGADVCGAITESKGASGKDLKINAETDAELRDLLLNLMTI